MVAIDVQGFTQTEFFEDTGSTHSGDADDSVDFVIGSRTGSYAFIGSIACVSIYNRALTADEVLINYNATKRRFK